MVLVIDNYDSFTYNLVQYLGELGATTEVRRNDQLTVDDIHEMKPERILISPGPGVPEKAGIIVELIKKMAGRLPILGVCLGHQAIAYAFGGKIIGAPTLMHGKISEVCHDSRTIFQGLPYRFKATRYHSLVVEQSTCPPCFEVSATTPEGVIMGIRHRDFKIEGVQFHPESVMTERGKKILENFLKL